MGVLDGGWREWWVGVSFLLFFFRREEDAAAMVGLVDGGWWEWWLVTSSKHVLVMRCGPELDSLSLMSSLWNPFSPIKSGGPSGRMPPRLESVLLSECVSGIY